MTSTVNKKRSRKPATAGIKEHKKYKYEVHNIDLPEDLLNMLPVSNEARLAVNDYLQAKLNESGERGFKLHSVIGFSYIVEKEYDS